ncbi:MAG TPA: phosphatidylglycerol lysyltransferase domain-containing protein, partial [Ornithinibacter sp.]|nr:phosphatidylglycerol lysyltransferase domain-containing protein [Ornithinibacter sp.]
MTATEGVIRPARDRASEGGRAPARRVSLNDDRWPDWLATFSFVLSAIALVTWLVPPLRHFFDRTDDPVSLATVPIVPNLVYAAVLFVLGVGLRRRLQSAWWAFVVLLLVLPSIGRVASLVGADRDPLDAVGLVVAVALLVAAVRARRQFTARTARRAGLTALVVFVVGTVLVSLVGTWMLTTFADKSRAGADVAIADVLLGDLGLVAYPGVVAPMWVRVLVNVMGAAVVLGSALVLFRSPAYTRTLSAGDEAAVRTLLRDHGDLDSLGYFATRRDKAIVWDTDDPARARAGVSYRVVRGVSLASGNPVGDPEHWPAAIEAWRRDARANGWSLAVMAAGSEGARAFEESGLTVFEIGDEAILDLGSFSLNAPGLKPVRQAVSRLHRRGYEVQVRRHDTLTPDDLDQLAASASSWRGDGGDERGFSMALGRLGDPLDGDCVLVEARDGTGALRGFISLVPWGRNGLSLDLMRRDPTADNGLVELLVASLAEQAPRLAVRRVSLNFAMFREAFTRGEELGAGPLARLGRQALLLASRNWQLESLYRSNAKYLPDWQPRFICFEYSSDLPRVGIAAGSAEGFLTAPSIRSTLRRAGARDEAL